MHDGYDQANHANHQQREDKFRLDFTLKGRFIFGLEHLVIELVDGTAPHLQSSVQLAVIPHKCVFRGSYVGLVQPLLEGLHD